MASARWLMPSGRRVAYEASLYRLYGTIMDVNKPHSALGHRRAISSVFERVLEPSQFARGKKDKVKGVGSGHVASLELGWV